MDRLKCGEGLGKSRNRVEGINWGETFLILSTIKIIFLKNLTSIKGGKMT